MMIIDTKKLIAPTSRKARWTIFVLIALLCLIISGCAPRFPLGIHEDQWHAMSHAEQLSAYQKQAEIDRIEAENRRTALLAREAETTLRLAELETRRREAEYGERVQCILSEAEVYLSGSWRAIEPIALDLVTGMVVETPIIAPRNKWSDYRSTLYTTFDGQTITLCQQKTNLSSRQGQNCARVLGTQVMYQRGIDTRIDSPQTVRGRMQCHLSIPSNRRR